MPDVDKPEVEYGEYRGNPTITLSGPGAGQYGFTFGLKKAYLILDNIEEIRRFTEAHKLPNQMGR